MVYTSFIILLFSTGVIATIANLALRKPSRQSSTFHNEFHLRADGANDGNKYPIIDVNSSCCHTNDYAGWHWWQVDLQSVYTIGSIRITNRQDCCQDRLQNLSVEVSTIPPDKLVGFSGRTSSPLCVTITPIVPVGPSIPYQCNQHVTGRYVRVVKYDNIQGLAICEFEIFEPRSWHFVYVFHIGQIMKSPQNNRYKINCALLRVKAQRDILSLPYIQIDLPGGNCRFLTNFTESQKSASSNWVIYKVQ